METLFIEARSNVELDNDLKKKIVDNLRGNKSVALCTAVQFIKHMTPLIEYLKRNGFVIEIVRTKKGKYEGQILGCDVPILKSDAVLYLGSGLFHPIMLAITNEKPILIANPNTGEVRFLEKREIEKFKTEERVGKALINEAKTIGLIVSKKSGQNRLTDALKLKQDLEKQGKRVYIFMFDTVDFSSFLNFPNVDAFISTVCPRLAIDDRGKFNKPIVNIDDL